MEHADKSSYPRRALCVGLSRFGIHDEEPPAGSYRELPYAPKRTRAVAEALSSLGYLSETLSEEELGTGEALGAAITSAINVGRNGDVQVVHVLSHGHRAQSSVYVVGADGEYAHSTSVAGWLAQVEDAPHRHRPHTLFLVDTCHAGAAARLDWLRAATVDTRAWVIAATLDEGLAYDGRFSQAVASVLAQIHSGEIDFYPSEYVPFSHVVEHIRRQVIQLGGEGQYVCSTPVDGNPVPPFFPNQRRPVGVGSVGGWEDLDPAAQPFADLDAGLDEAHFLDRAKGHGGLGAGVTIGCFTGREPELETLTSWLNARGRGGLRLVTGGPGSGKSALLGILVCSAHPQLREHTRRIWEHVGGLPDCGTADLAAVHLRERRLAEILGSLMEQLRLPINTSQPTAEMVISAIATLRNPPIIIADALDEALGQAELVQDLLLPLAESKRTDGEPACTLMVGMRPWEQFTALQDLAERDHGVLDLDAVPSTRLQDELSDYVQDLLSLAPSYSQRRDRPIRRAIGRQTADALTRTGQERGGEFLSAALFVNWLVTKWPDGVALSKAEELIRHVPRSVRDILELDLATHAPQPWFRAVLVTLAHARGAGMPATVIRRLAPLCRSQDSEDGGAGTQLSVPEFDHVLQQVRFYLRSSPDTDGTTLYRLFHQGLVDHLRSEDVDLGSLVSGLLTIVPFGPDHRRTWDAAEPYVRRHALQHAADAGRLDELIQADSDGLESMSDSVVTPIGRVSMAVCQESTNTVAAASLDVRRDLMAVNAVRYGFPELAATLAHVPKLAHHHWWPEWATGGQLPSIPGAVLVGPGGGTQAIACGESNGRRIAVMCDVNCALRAWDIATGQPVGNLTVGPDIGVQAVACTKLAGRAVVVTGGADQAVRVWDLETGHPVGKPMTGHKTSVLTVACTELDGRALAVTSGADHTVRVWDLETSHLIGKPIRTRNAVLDGVGCTQLDGRIVAVAVIGGKNPTLQVWDCLATDKATERSINYYEEVGDEPVRAIACTDLNGRAVAVTGNRDGIMRVWDLETGQLIGNPMIGHEGTVHAIACTELVGRAVAVTGGADQTVRVWDLETGQPIGNPMIGHEATVQAVTCTKLDGRVLAITGGDDGMVRIWDLADRRFTGDPLIGHSAAVQALGVAAVGGHPVAVSGGDDRTVRIWDLASGHPIYYPMTTPVGGIKELVCARVGCHDVAVTGGGNVYMFDVAPRRKQMVGKMLIGAKRSFSGLVRAIQDYESIVVTTGGDGELYVWDIAHRMSIGVLSDPDFKSRPTSVACTTFDGRRVAVASADGTVWVWDLTSGERIAEPMTGPKGLIRTVACGRLNASLIAVTAGDDGMVWVWDLAAGRPIGEPITGHRGPIHTVACSTVNGQSLAVTGGQDSVMRVWDLATAKELEAFSFPGVINDVLFTRAGDLLVGFGWEVAYLRHVHKLAAAT